MNSKLFSGRIELFGGLTNEKLLVKLCPEEFLIPNEWSDYSMKMFFFGHSIENWKWKSEDKNIQSSQYIHLIGLLKSFNIKHEDKEAVAGWMLSEMLEEVPEYLPNPNKKGGE